MTPANFWRQVGWVAAKDLRLELRGGSTVRMAIPFTALALLLAPLAIGTDTALLRRIGPGMLWLVLIVYGTTITLGTGSDPDAVRDLLTLSGLDPAADFVGRGLAGAILLLGAALVLAPLMVVFYAPDGRPAWWWLIGLTTAGVSALGLLGALAGLLVQGLASRTLLGSLLVVPAAVPVLLATSRGTEAAITGQGGLGWLGLLLAVDLVFLITGVLLAGPLRDPAR